MNQATQKYARFHGDQTTDYEEIKLFGSLVCFVCGTEKGPLRIENKHGDPSTEFGGAGSQEKKNLYKDAGFVSLRIRGDGEEGEFAPACRSCAVESGMFFEVV